MEKFSTTIPFSGFYYTVHDDIIQSHEDQLFLHNNGTSMPELLSDKFFDSCDYKSIHNNYAKEYVVELAKILKIQIDYEELVSPREYNFQTDRIFGKISRSDLAKMLWKVKGKKLNDKITQRFTNRDGFRSFYSNKIKDWGRISNWDHNQIGTVLEAYCEEIDIDYNETIMENINSCGIIFAWLYEHGGEWGQWAIRTAEFLGEFRERD